MDLHPSGTRIGPKPSTRRTSEALWDWDLVSDRIHFSPDWLALAGCHDQEIGNTPDDWVRRVHPDDRPQLQREIETARRGEASECELRYRLRHSDGRYRWMRSLTRIVRNQRGEAIRLTGTQEDVTVEMVTDAVTGLPNRLLLVEHLALSIQRARRQPAFHFAVLILDVGRPPGPVLTSRPSSDPLLNSVARRLETCLRMPEAMSDRRHSDLVARLDGDRFAVLVDGVSDLGQAKDLADRILAEMLQPIQINGRDLRLTPSIGIALSATGYTGPEEPVRDAEIALHRARVLGGSHAELFDADLLRSEQTALELEREMEAALQRREFVLLYQPVVSLTTGEVVGFEALVRWQHPTLGRLAPLDFIPLAERTGLIVPLSRWILEEACTQLKTWQASIPQAAAVWMSVNLSAVQLRESEFVEEVQEALHRADIDPHHLTLEITEGVAVENPVAVTTALMRLRSMGIRISLDDFGTGYSSLAYLRQLPVDALKIDQSFVRRLGSDKNSTAIVTSILSMARELSLSVIAEGVELGEQLRVLQGLECTAAQGYLFAKALGADEAADFLQAGPVSMANVVSSEPATSDAQSVQPWLAQWVSWIGHRVLATSAVVGVLILAGVGAVFFGASSFTIDQLPAVTPPPAWGGSAGDTDRRLSLAAALRLLDERPRATTPSVVTERATGLPGVAAASGASAAAVPTNASFDVVHLHRFGNCVGRLVISANGITFDVNDKVHADEFTLKHTDFVPVVDPGTLTIRTERKDYRFTVPGKTSDKAAQGQITTIANAILRSRPK